MEERDHDMLIAHEQQINRIVADAESEKDTRRRVNVHIEERLTRIYDALSKHERWFWMAIGGGSVILFIVEMWGKT